MASNISLLICFAIFWVYSLKGSNAKGMPVQFSKVTDCQKGSKGAFDFSKLKVSKDKKQIDGDVNIKKDVPDVKVSITTFRIRDGDREDYATFERDICKGFEKTPQTIFISFLKQAVGEKCPVKKGKRKVSTTVITEEGEEKLVDNIIQGWYIKFADSSCVELEIEPRK